MTAVAGVRLPDVSTLKGKSILKRIAIATKYANKVDRHNPKGLDMEKALEFLQHFKPAFGDLRLLRSQPEADKRRVLKLDFRYYTCQACKLDFDEKDLKGLSPEGILCPKCGEVVVRAAPAPEPKQEGATNVT